MEFANYSPCTAWREAKAEVVVRNGLGEKIVKALGAPEDR